MPTKTVSIKLQIPFDLKQYSQIFCKYKLITVLHKYTKKVLCLNIYAKLRIMFTAYLR